MIIQESLVNNLDYRIIRREAHNHYIENGDRVVVKKSNDAHASYSILRGPLTKYAYVRVGKNWMDAEDCVQDAYVKVLETAKPNEFFNFAGLYKIWLDRAIRDKNIDKRRAGKVFVDNYEIPNTGGLTVIDITESDAPPPDLLIEVQNRVDDVIRLSNEFKPKAKAIIRLILLFGYTYSEVGHMLNVSTKRVDNTVTYFRSKFK